jgi:hypothetical protein
MYKEIKKLDQILKSQKKQCKKLDKIVSVIKDRKNEIALMDEDNQEEIDPVVNLELENHLDSLLSKYIKSDYESKFELNVIKCNKYIYLGYNNGNLGTSKNTNLEYLSIHLSEHSCNIDSNLYNNNFKTELSSKYFDDIFKIFKEQEIERMDSLFNEIMLNTNLNRGNSLSEIEDILED